MPSPRHAGNPHGGRSQDGSPMGELHQARTITLNLDLVKVPLTFIDYVIVHELCHLKIHNHSPAFYKLLTRSMPDWRQRKERLETFVN